MKKVLIILFVTIMSIPLFSQTAGKDTALILIDIQDFYFPGGKLPLVNPENAADHAKLLLDHFRDHGLLVIHVRHNAETGGNINKIVEPLASEIVISKDDVNAFKGTDLLKILNQNSIKTIVVCGMQTHMCVEGCVRAAYDYGFNVILVEDACATRNLKYNDYEIQAKDVHYSTLATLKAYATVTNTESFLHPKK
jgi:nicotinamidase-related amidase